MDKFKNHLHQIPLFKHEGHGGHENDSGQPPQHATGQQSQPPQQTGGVAGITQKAIDVFLYSKQDNGEIGGIGYWQTANGYTAILCHDHWSGSSTNVNNVRDSIAKVSRYHPNLINEFNDDTLWWAQCLMQMFYITQDRSYVDQAGRIWTHVSRSVIARGKISVRGMDMEGGVMWTTRPGEDHVNAITTGLYAELCADLAALSDHQRPHGLPSAQQLVEAAKVSLGWILRCRYRPNDALVTDTIKLKTQELVDWTFTYNTAAALAACTALYAITSDNSYMALAEQMAIKSMHRPEWVESDGTLTESGAYGRGKHEAWKNDDAVGFKSVLVRSLSKLYKLLQERGANSELADEIRAFIFKQFQSLQERDTNGKGQYGPWWAGPMDMPTSHSQLAVLDVMAAIRLVSA